MIVTLVWLVFFTANVNDEVEFYVQRTFSWSNLFVLCNFYWSFNLRIFFRFRCILSSTFTNDFCSSNSKNYLLWYGPWHILHIFIIRLINHDWTCRLSLMTSPWMSIFYILLKDFITRISNRPSKSWSPKPAEGWIPVNGNSFLYWFGKSMVSDNFTSF